MPQLYFYRNPSLPPQMQTQMYGGTAAAIGTAVAQREWQDGLTRLFPVRVLTAFHFSALPIPSLNRSGPFRPGLAVFSIA